MTTFKQIFDEDSANEVEKEAEQWEAEMGDEEIQDQLEKDEVEMYSDYSEIY